MDPIDPSVSTGQWEPVFNLQNGRHSVPGAHLFESLNEHFCSTFLWDPVTGGDVPTAQQPRLGSGEGVNLFCSGHNFLPNGRLLVVGGHLFDQKGVDQTCIYDAFADAWTALPRMNNGRWYPSALALPDGGVLAISGSLADGRPQPPPDNPTRPAMDTHFHPNPNPQIWRGNAWVTTRDFWTLPLYPRLHVEPKQGRVFMAGPQGESFFLDIAGAGTWTPGPRRDNAMRDYAPSVMYESGKILYIGGGLDENTHLPTMLAETIDLNGPNPQWIQTAPMRSARRQHNATVLPDGTVLVTGGTRGASFNDLSPGAPVHQAELWDPATRQWTPMAEESVDRCYHSTALLLPDGRVLSAGGGEYAPDNGDQPNPPSDSYPNAQLFKPPYLSKKPRPTVSAAPTEITYGESFNVLVGAFDSIAKVSWVRLGSVTHSCNQNQLLNFLEFQQVDSRVTVNAPSSANTATPGHYMLFMLNEQGVPSIARIVRIAAQAIPPQAAGAALAQPTPAAVHAPVNLMALNMKITTDHGVPPIVVGVTPTCPYGLGGCWGGAFDALQRLSNIKVVRPVPDNANSLAFVYLKEDKLPDIDAWRDQFAKFVNGIYIMRGIEMTLSGVVTEQLSGLTLTGTELRPDLVLAQLHADDKIQWDNRTRANWPMTVLEADAFAQLSAALAAHPAGATVQVTGPLKKRGDDFVLEVREFEIGPT